MRLGLAVLLSILVSAQANAFVFDSTMPADQISSIQYDQEYLKTLQFLNNETDRETAKVLGIEGPLTGEALQAWMDERVSTVVSENVDQKATLFALNGTVEYPDPTELPVIETPTKKTVKRATDVDSQASNQVFTVMANIGAAVYENAKAHHFLALFHFLTSTSEMASLPLESPHHGVIQVGEGLFRKDVLAVNPEQPNTPANAIVRLMTFLHESRHSDGHGSSLGFFHSVCPAGTAYAGTASCDKSLNGAYTVGALVMKSMIQACTDCSVRDKVILRAVEADSASRIQKFYPDASGAPQVAKSLDASFEHIVSYVKAPPAPSAPAPVASADHP